MAYQLLHNLLEGLLVKSRFPDSWFGVNDYPLQNIGIIKVASSKPIYIYIYIDSNKDCPIHSSSKLIDFVDFLNPLLLGS